MRSSCISRMSERLLCEKRGRTDEFCREYPDRGPGPAAPAPALPPALDGHRGGHAATRDTARLCPAGQVAGTRAYRLDALAVAAMPDLDRPELLLAKLAP